jgi:Flp pilus assembly pilin Flp
VLRVLSTILAADPDRPDRRSMAGQGLAEYALILTLIAIIAILSLIFLGSDIQRLLSQVGTSV